MCSGARKLSVMAPRSAADTVVVTQAFGKEMRSLRQKLTSKGTLRKPGDSPQDVLSVARLAGLLDDCDPSTITRYENGTFKQLKRDTIEQIAAALEQPPDEGRLFRAARILPRTGERALFPYRLALGSKGLPLTVAETRRIHAAMFAEQVYWSRLNGEVPTPVPEGVLFRVGRISRRTFVRAKDLNPETPLVTFQPRVPTHPQDAAAIVIGLPEDLNTAVYQFALAHAVAHRLLGHDHCGYLPMVSSPARGMTESPQLSVDELMANDVAVRLLAPEDAVRVAYANAVAAVTRSDEDADFWAVEPPDTMGSALPTWAMVVMAVAKELNVPGWLALRRLTEEGLLYIPGMTGSHQ